MVAVKAADVDRAVRSRDARTSVLLFYGPDAGRVNERARIAAEAFVEDPLDPFQLVRLEGDALADMPSRLVEEATTFGMFGGRRSIWVRPTSRNIASSVSVCLDVELTDTLLVVEGGDLSKAAPLRVVCERSPRALSLPCYADEARDVASVISEALGASGQTITAEARQALIDSLGGDRLATRTEVHKLLLYARGQREITLDDVEAVVSDVSATTTDAAIDAAFAGDRLALDEALLRLAAQAVHPAQILSGALRHANQLLVSIVALGEHRDEDDVLRRWRGLHFKRKAAVARQIRAWSALGAEDVVASLQRGLLETRRSPQLAMAIVSRGLLAIAEAARGRSGRR